MCVALDHTLKPDDDYIMPCQSSDSSFWTL